jgi:hypothetical protein
VCPVSNVGWFDHDSVDPSRCWICGQPGYTFYGRNSGGPNMTPLNWEMLLRAAREKEKV